MRQLIRFIDLEPQATGDARLAHLAALDPDDLPTGSLAALLGPCLVFSCDRHLVDSGIARNDWGFLMTHARDVGTFQAGQSGSIVLVFLVGAMAGKAAMATAALARWSPLIAVVVLGVSGELVHSWWISERGIHQRAELRSTAREAWSRLGPFMVRVNECQELLERVAFVPEDGPSQVALVARAVAVAPHPRRAAEIGEQCGLSMQRVTALLRDPMFTRTDDGRYVLGVKRYVSTDS